MDAVWKTDQRPPTSGSESSSCAQLTLFDLPNEILHLIVSDSILTKQDVFVLATVCRRFNALALPVYLATHGILDPPNETRLYVIDWDPDYITNVKKPDALSGLNISPSLSTIANFQCFFQDPALSSKRNTYQKAFNLPHAVQRVSTFVQRMDHIGTAAIYLVWDAYFVTRDKTLTHVPLSDIQLWSDSLGGLVNSVVERGCKSLTVQFEAAIESAFHFRHGGRVKKAVSYVSQGIWGKESASSPNQLEWELERPLHEEGQKPEIKPASLSDLAERSNSVESLSIHSDVLLTPPFVNWTLALIASHTSLTSLTFAHIGFAKGIWQTVLPSIGAALSGRLTSLSFYRNCPHLEASDLLQFLSQLPLLTHLSVDRAFRYRFESLKSTKRLTTASKPFLGHLQWLQAPIEVVSVLLEASAPSSHPRHRRFSLPELRTLTVYPSSQLLSQENYTLSTQVVDKLFTRVKALPHGDEITYCLDAQMEVQDFSRVAHILHTQPFHHGIYQSLWDALVASGSASEAGDSVSQSSSSRMHSIVAFEHVTHIVFYKFNPREGGYSANMFCLWLRFLFPGLKQVGFSWRFEGQPELEGVGVRGGMEQEVVEELVKELRKVCPGVRRLVVAGRVYDM